MSEIKVRTSIADEEWLDAIYIERTRFTQQTASILGADLNELSPAAIDQTPANKISQLLLANKLRKCNVRRFIVLFTTSTQDPSDKDTLKFKSRRVMIRLSRPTTFEQIVKYSQLVCDLDIDRTLVKNCFSFN